MRPKRYLVLMVVLIALLTFSGILSAGVRPSIDADGDYVERISGEDRYLTAIDISQKIFPDAESADAVVLTRSREFPDGLAGAPLAFNKNGPVLLTGTDSLKDVTADEIARVLKPDGTVYVLGGVAAISEDVVSSLEADGYDVERLGGDNRYSTAVEIAKELTSAPENVFLVTGEDFADALSISSVAAELNAPVLLTRTNALSDATAAYLSENEATIENIYVIGGINAVSEDVYTAAGGTERIEGADRFFTAQAVAEKFFIDPNLVVLATSHDFPDALSGGVLAAAGNAPLLLTRPAALHTASAAYIAANHVDQVLILGGTNVVSDAVINDLYPHRIIVNSGGGSIEGEQWPADTEISVTVNGDDILTETVATDGEGNFSVGVFPLGVTLESGDVVAVSGGGYSREHKIRELEVTGFDEDADTVSGTAKAGSLVEVVAFIDGGLGPIITVEASSDGTWTADFSGHIDLVEGDTGSASISDAAGNSTLIYWHVSYPGISVFPDEDKVIGFSFAAISTITVAIDDGGAGHSDTTTSDDSGYFSLVLDGYSIAAGQVVTVTDGSGNSKTHIVSSLAVTEINRSTGVVKGTADEGTVNVSLSTPFVGPGGGPPIEVDSADVVVGSDGTWEYNYGGVIEDDVDITVKQEDEDNDATVIEDKVS